MPRPTTTKLLHVFKKLNGARFRGFLTTPLPFTSGVSSMPVRLLHVLKPCFIIPGDVVTTEDGSRIMTMEAEQGTDLFHTFQAVLVTFAYPWSRKEQIKDPVSKVMKDGQKIELGVVYAYFDRPQNVSFEKLTETRYQFFTGQNVLVGDTVGGKLVNKVTPIAGVKLVFAE